MLLLKLFPLFELEIELEFELFTWLIIPNVDEMVTWCLLVVIATENSTQDSHCVKMENLHPTLPTEKKWKACKFL